MLLVLFTSTILNSQEKILESEQWINIDKNLMYNIVIAADRDQNITKGLLYGVKGDSIYLYLNKKMSPLALRNLTTLSIENTKRGNLATVAGAFSGMYLGTLLFLTSKDHPARYLEYEDSEMLTILYELVFVTIGRWNWIFSRPQFNRWARSFLF